MKWKCFDAYSEEMLSCNKGRKTRTIKEKSLMKRMIMPLVVAAILAAGYLVCCAAVDGEKVLPRTLANGIDISGMKIQDAVGLLRNEETLSQGTVTVPVRFAESEYSVDVGSAVEWEYQSAVEELQKPTRGAFLTRGYFLIKSYLVGNNIEPSAALKSEEALEEAVKTSGLSKEGTTKQTACRVEQDSLIFTMGTAGEEADIDKLKEELKAAILANDGRVVECPVSAGKVEEVDLDSVYQEICKNPKNASLDPANNYEIKEAEAGIWFDKETARKALETAEEGSRVTVELIREEPEITTEDLREHLFIDRLASYSTEVRGTDNRKDNISLAVSKCDGAILLSGDIFSYNNTVGEQTAETGYKLANATLDGTVIQAYGGGICQVSSTIFAAALYANLDIKERWEHEFVSSYIDAGMDAAVAWDVLDFKIGNNKEYPIRIDIIYENDILTVDIWGTKTDDSFVEIDTQVVDDSGGKLSVLTSRRVYSGDQSQMFVEQVANSTYIN